MFGDVKLQKGSYECTFTPDKLVFFGPQLKTIQQFSHFCYLRVASFLRCAQFYLTATVSKSYLLCGRPISRVTCLTPPSVRLTRTV